jgi:hypothetical protein
MHGSRTSARMRCARLPGGLAALLAVLAWADGAAAQTLRGSQAALMRQNREAEAHDFTFVRDRRELTRFVDAALLVPLEGNENYRLHNVSFGVARPEVRLFVERLSAQYRQACGEPLVVTSLTRPASRQPPNASRRSVHPTGMALDLRRPASPKCRRWLESTLLNLDGQDVLDATRETRPPHYHVALFPRSYIAHVASLTGVPQEEVLAEATRHASHTVRRGESLARIAKRYGIAVADLRRTNGLTSATIHPGQQLMLPRR